jgi:general secretion pathway protein F
VAIYTYKARKASGELVRAKLEAASRQEALARLDSLGLFPLSLEEEFSRRRRSRVALKDLMEFTHQLSVLVNSGSTLLDSLNTLAGETEHAMLKPVVADILSQVKEGSDFSQALKKYPHIFSQFYISLIKVGEASGTLGQNLRSLAEFLEEELDFRATIVSILTYPLLIAGVGLLTIFVLLKFVIPKLVNIFQEIEQALPLPTLILVKVSDFFSQYWLFILGFIVLFFWGLSQFLRRPAQRLSWHRRKLTLPLVGELFKRIELCRFSRILSMLLKNGLPLSDSLRVLTFTVSNLFLRQKLEALGVEINEGSSLHEAMRRQAVFPRGFVNVITVGEQSARLEEVLDTVSLEYKKEIDRRIKRLLGFLEPALIVGVGLAVGFVVLSMLLPIFDLDFNF